MLLDLVVPGRRGFQKAVGPHLHAQHRVASQQVKQTLITSVADADGIKTCFKGVEPTIHGRMHRASISSKHRQLAISPYCRYSTILKDAAA
jgi:hypothetical protein